MQICISMGYNITHIIFLLLSKFVLYNVGLWLTQTQKSPLELLGRIDLVWWQIIKTDLNLKQISDGVLDDIFVIWLILEIMQG